MKNLLRNLPVQLVIVFISTVLLMTGYETLKEIYFQGMLTLWESHSITIVITALFAVGAALFMRRLANKLVTDANEAKSNVSLIIENLFDAVIIIDKHCIITMVNSAATQKFGYTSTDLIGRNVNTLMPEPYASEHNGYIKHYLTTKKPKIIGNNQHRVLNGMRANGEVFLMDLAVNAIVSNGQPAFIGTIRELTEDRRVDAEMRRLRDTEKKMLAYIENELQMAGQIQANMLTTNFLLYPDCKEFDVFALMAPASQMGGDFYDVLLIDSNKVFVAVGDVTGKGISAALHMAECVAYLRTIALRESKPHKILQKLNNRLCENNNSGMYITLCCGIFNIDTGEFIYSSAGHAPPLTNTDSEYFGPAQIPRAIVLGFTKEAKYKSMRLQLKSGDSIFLYSDGVTDAENKHGDLFSDEKLLEILSASQESTSKTLIERVKTEIDNFSHGVNQTDDITMLCFNYLSSPVSDM